MAELIGAVASAVAIAGAAGSAASKLKNLWDEVQNVPETITDLVLQIEILESHICQMESEINHRGTSIRPIFDDSTVRLSTEYCRGCMKGLAGIVDDLRENIDNQKNSKRAYAKIRVVLKKQVLVHFERRLQRAVSVLNLTQQGYAVALIKLQPRIIMGLLTAHDSHLNVLDENTDMPATGAFQTGEIDFGVAHSFRREGHASYRLSVKPNITKRPWRSWSNSLMNGTIGIHCSTRQLAPHSMPETSYTIRINLPDWLVKSVWDFQVTKATSGWKTNLRSWRVAPDSLAIKAVRDNDYHCLIDSLVSGRATIFDRTQAGDTLLHLAAQHANRKVVRLLVESGLDFAERNDEFISALRRFIYHFQQRSTRPWPTYLSDMLSLLSSQGALEDPVYDWVTSFTFIGAPMLTVLDFPVQSEGALDPLMPYKSYVMPRMQYMELFFVAGPGDWSPQGVQVLIWKHGRIHQENISTAMADGFPIWTLLAYRIGTSESPSDDSNMQEWQKFMQDISGATGSDYLHTLATVPGFQPWLVHAPANPLTPLLWLLLLTLDTLHAEGHPYSSFEEVYISNLRPALQRWLALLKGCGVDLEEYGGREQDILQGDQSFSLYDWELPGKRNAGENARLRSIIHGTNVEDWGLVWEVESLQHGIEIDDCEPRLYVPGGWPEEALETDAETEES